MILRELFMQPISEAREDSIAKNQDAKILATYNQKDVHKYPTKFNKSIDIVNFISNNTIPQYIQWTVNAYLTDRSLSFEDLPEVKVLLTKYTAMKKKTGNLVEKDINHYTYESLISAISEIESSQDPQHANTLISTYFDTMNQQVSMGNATWKYNSSNVSIYTPTNYTGTKALRECAPNDISLCVTYTNTDSFYNNYVMNGALEFILTSNQLYLFFFSNDESITPSEFADRSNKHEILSQLLKEQPVLSKIYEKEIKSLSPFVIIEENLLTFNDDKISRISYYKLAIASITNPIQNIPLQYESHFLQYYNDVCSVTRFHKTIIEVFDEFFPPDRDSKSLMTILARIANELVMDNRTEQEEYVAPDDVDWLGDYGFDARSYWKNFEDDRNKESYY